MSDEREPAAECSVAWHDQQEELMREIQLRNRDLLEQLWQRSLASRYGEEYLGVIERQLNLMREQWDAEQRGLMEMEPIRWWARRIMELLPAPPTQEEEAKDG